MPSSDGFRRMGRTSASRFISAMFSAGARHVLDLESERLVMTPDECHGKMFHASLVQWVLLSATGSFRYVCKFDAVRRSVALTWRNFR